MNKECRSCRVVKPFSEFYIIKRNEKHRKYKGKDSWPSSRCKECNTLYMIAWYKKNPETKRRVDYEYKRRLRLKALNHYSNNNPKCICCGEKEIDFLCLDHVNNDGNKERAVMGIGIGYYQNLIKGGFKSNLQVLCFNCNAGKQKFGGCPHKRKPTI